MDLRSVKLFAGMRDRDLEQIAKQMREVRHARGAEVTVPDGHKRVLRAGDHFGEMALLDQAGRSASVTATTDLVVGAIPSWHFKPFLIEHPEVAYRMLQILSHRLREAEAH